MAPSSEPHVPLWPIDPDPATTNLVERQGWYFAGSQPEAVAVVGSRLDPGDPRLGLLGIRRNAAGRPYPAHFAFCPETGKKLASAAPPAPPAKHEFDPDSHDAIPFTEGVPSLSFAGHPERLYLSHDNLGALEWWDAASRAWIGLGRIPPADLPPIAHGLAATRHGLAYATRDCVVVVPLPQLEAQARFATLREPGLTFVAAPVWRADGLFVPAARAGRLVLCHLPMARGEPAGALALHDLDMAAGDAFGRPVVNRLGDTVWPGEAGFLRCRGDCLAGELERWPAEFEPVLAQPPYRDGGDVAHQLGMFEGRYHYASLTRAPALQRLNGPHLAAGATTYSGGERFLTPWGDPVESLTLGAYAGSLILPLIAMARDTVLLAIRIESAVADFIRGRPLRRPVTAHALHHAHGAGLRRLPVSLEIASIHDAKGFVHAGRAYLYSRAERRCHGLDLR